VLIAKYGRQEKLFTGMMESLPTVLASVQATPTIRAICPDLPKVV